ncbi:MAG: arylsulfatase [Bacteroidia bacterium]|nr:arylsulfatase [Bacteroidia bacterium]
MRHILLFLIIQLTGCISAFSQDSLGTSPPNILLIVVDDMGWNDVSYHGSEIQTPFIDSLASQGVELDRFYVHSACTPTRSSLMTGKTAVRLGCVNPISKNNKLGLPLSEKIMPQYFKEKGYSTALVGKWHLGRYKKENWPYNRGFDHFYGNLTGGIGHYDHVHGGALDWQRNGVSIEEEGYTTHLLTAEAIKLLKAKGEKPFFLELCYAAPHMPNEAPEEAIFPYREIENKNRQLHAAMVSEVDKGIQKIIETLEETGLMKNTIIWFMSDNGGKNLVGTPKKVSEPILSAVETWGEPLPFPFWEFLRDNMINGAGDNSPLKGGKATVYEGGLRVPAFIYAPSFLSQQKINQRITVNDVLPSLAAAAGIHHVDTTDLDGVNQWSFMKNEAPYPKNTFVSEGKWKQAYFKDEWKLVVDKKGDDRPELYKVMEDPTESHDLAAQNPELVSSLAAELQAFPRGESIDDPLWRVFLDPDQFGGKANRKPYAGVEGRNMGPLHPIFYALGTVFLILLVLIIWILSMLFRTVSRDSKK